MSYEFLVLFDSSVFMGFSAKLIHDFHLILDNSIIAISDNRLCPTLKVSDDVEILTILCNKTHLSFCK